MAETSIDVQRIVREVIAELGRLPGATTSGGTASLPGSARETSGGTASLPGSAREAASGELMLDDRIVTMRQIDGRLGGIRRVVVPRQAVVTPAVRDELIRRGIELAYGATTDAASGGLLRLLVVTTGRRFDPGRLIAAMSKEPVAVEPHRLDCLIVSTDLLAAEIAKPNTLGLLLTRHTAAALCLANRHQGVRAVSGPDGPSLADATAAVGANLLVVDPAMGSPFQLARIVTEFCRGGVRPCPEVFRARLT